MAEEKKAEEGAGPAEAQAPFSGKRKALLFAGGGAVVLALAFMASMMAIPTRPKLQRFEGPFKASLFEDKFSVNLEGNHHRQYLQMQLDIVFYALDKSYYVDRLKDDLYDPYLRSAITTLVSKRDVEDVMDISDEMDPESSAFINELRDAIDPVVFPVHIGNTRFPSDIDKQSGLRPGLDADHSTFRGRIYNHVVHVDAPKRSLQLDDGPVVEFRGEEADLKLLSADGEVLYVDVTNVKPDFVGDVPVGVKGQIARILKTHWLVQ